MFIADIEITDKHQTIMMPVVKAITSDVIASFGADTFDKVNYLSEISGGITEKNKREITMSGNRVLTVEFSDTYGEESQATGMANRPRGPAIIMDELIGLSAHVKRNVSNLRISIKASSSSRNEVKSIFDRYFSKINSGHESSLHDVKYMFGIPDPVINLLHHSWSLMESNSGYGRTFQQYVFSIASRKINLVSDSSGSSKKLIVNEAQTRIQGSLKPAVHDKETIKKNDEGIYEYEIEYNITIDVPMSIQLRYPIMIHNRMIGSDYIPKAPIDHHNLRTNNIIGYSLMTLETPRSIGIETADEAVSIPPEDSFRAGFIDQPGLKPLLIALTQVDPEHPKDVLNMKDLGDMMIDPSVVSFLIDYDHSKVTEYGKCVFKINVYENDIRIPDRLICCDKNLIIKVATDMSQRCTYRVVFSISSKLDWLNESAWDSLRANPKILALVLSTMNPNIGRFPEIREMYKSDKLLPYQELWVKNNVGFFSNKVRSRTGKTSGPYGVMR